MGLSIDVTQVNRVSSDGNTVNEGTKTVSVGQAHIVFDKLPETKDELQSIDRSGENGKYVTMALLFAVVRNWTPEKKDVCNSMLEILLNSPTCGITFNNFGREFVRDRMMQNNKYPYLGNSYFDGATPENGYTPSSPLTVTLEEYVYNLPPSTMYGSTLSIERVVTRFAGADTERYVDFYMDPKDGNWYIWSDTYKSILADIKTPM
ncbi:MAG: hypothetical protein II915_04990 [Eubacterium sp.]|nr:hypothetical protein [Eubacterium sp.]